MDLWLPHDIQGALQRRAGEEGRSAHAVVIQAIGRYLVEEADRATVRELGAKYATRHAGLSRRLGE